VTFLQPLLLFLGILIAVPFIIHLFGERKYHPLPFSSLKFLREIELESLNKLKWRQWIILLTRALWIAMLVLALSHPFFAGSKGALEPGIMLIDHSFSTSIDPDYQIKTKKIRDHFSRWTFLEYNERTNIDSLQKKLEDAINNQRFKEPFIVMLSDFQANEQNQQIYESIKQASLHHYTIPLFKENTNYSVVSVKTIDSEIGLEKTQGLEIELSSADGDYEHLACDVHFDAQQVGRVEVSQEGLGYFYYSQRQSDEILSVVIGPRDDYPQDNNHYLLIKEMSKINILYVQDLGEVNYVENALLAMEDIQVTTIPSDALLTEDLNDYDMIWFSEAYSISMRTLEGLKKYAKEKPLVINVGPKASIESWTSLLGDLVLQSQDAFIRVINTLNPKQDDKLRLKKYYKSDLVPEAVLWELNSGDPLLMQMETKCYAMLSSFQFDWNEIGLSAYFTTMLKEFFRFALRAEKQEYYIGDIIEIDQAFSKVYTPQGEVFQVKEAFSETSNPGIYRIEAGDSRRHVAVNIPQEECRQTQLSMQNENTIEWDGKKVEDIDRRIKGRNGETLFYILAVLLIILEMILVKKGESSK
jgi:hypothetical protein